MPGRRRRNTYRPNPTPRPRARKVKKEFAENSTEYVKSWNTALKRRVLSVPAALSVKRRFITPEESVLDYGCGRGDDVRLLKAQGFNAEGFDPYHNAIAVTKQYDTAMLTYVLNVLHRPQDRHSVVLACLARLKGKGSKVVVTVRTSNEKVLGTAFEDGVLTRRHTFQKLYKPGELDTFLSKYGRVVRVNRNTSILYKEGF